MQYPLCRHILTNGVQCGSPSLNNRTYCFFHQRLFDRHKAFRLPTPNPELMIFGEHIELGPLEDRSSVQFALSVIVNALATGQLDRRRGTALLYGLQLLSANAPRQDAASSIPDPATVVRSVEYADGGFHLALPGALTEDFDTKPQPQPLPGA